MTAPARVVVSGMQLRAWQREAFEAWNGLGRRGVVEAVTGTGKTTLGIAAAADALSRGLKVLVVVPGIDLLDQWYRSIKLALPGCSVGRRGAGGLGTFDTCDILVSTVQSAIQRNAPRPTGPALLVADEVHRYGALTFSQLLTDEFDERLGLTATFERNDLGVELHLRPYFGSVITGCSYERGHADGILAPVRVMLVAVPFSDQEQADYRGFDEAAKRERGNLIAKYGCPAEPFGEFMRSVQVLAEGGADRSTWSARNFLGAFSKRRAVLAQCRGKIETLRGIGDVLGSGGRTLVFSETKESSRAAAEVLLEAGVLAAPYTSDLSRPDRIALLTAFREGVMKALVAPKVLDEGVDVPEADLGIILAGSKSRRQMIQRMGRIIRPKADGRQASFLVLYARGSSEDPEQGAHESFLEQLTGIASEVARVSADEAPALLALWQSTQPELVRDASNLDQEYEEIAHRLVAEVHSDEAVESSEVGVLDEIRFVLRETLRGGSVEEMGTLLMCLSILEPDEVSVILRRYGLSGGQPMSNDAIGAELVLTSNQVAALERSAIASLGEPGTAELLAALL